MKTLLESLNNFLYESTFSNKDWMKPNHTYARDVIGKLIAGEPVKTGDKGNGGDYVATQEQRDKLAKLNPDYSQETLNQFNDIFGKDFGWTKIFKGDFSGHGVENPGNKGNAFEYEFIDNYKEKYEDEILKIFPYDELKNIKADGALNQKRPLQISGKNIILSPCRPGQYEIGQTVTDVTLETDKGPVYLSLKYGKSVTFCNVGIKKQFDKRFFEGKPNREALAICDLFCLDPERVKDIFNNYNETGKRVKASKDTVDITRELAHNKQFENFLKSVIGYGFILVHQIGSQVHYHDLLTEKKLDELIGNIKSAEIQYPTGGEAKRVDIVVETGHLKLKFNLRSKDGGVYPSHIMSDYEII